MSNQLTALTRAAEQWWPSNSGVAVEATVDACQMIDARLRSAVDRIVTATPGSVLCVQQRAEAEAVRRELQHIIADLLIGEHFGGAP